MKYIVGNWKMNGDAALAQKLIAASKPSPHEVILCCPFTLLHLVQGISKGAQDCSPETHGAYTGDISATMLKQAGCEWVIVGHSERRQHHKESDALIARKAQAAISAGLKVIYCVGETLEEREAGRAEEVVKNQLSFFTSHKPQTTSHYLIAYEPVWAIGTGLTPTSDQIAVMHCFIKEAAISNASSAESVSSKGNNIDFFRKKSGKSMEELASDINISRVHLQNLKSGKKPMSLPMLKRIAEGLKCEPYELITPLEKLKSRGQSQHFLPSLEMTKVLYGGSVKPENIQEILSIDSVDGVLVGGASIDPDAWAQIVKQGFQP